MRKDQKCRGELNKYKRSHSKKALNNMENCEKKGSYGEQMWFRKNEIDKKEMKLY